MQTAGKRGFVRLGAVEKVAEVLGSIHCLPDGQVKMILTPLGVLDFLSLTVHGVTPEDSLREIKAVVSESFKLMC